MSKRCLRPKCKCPLWDAMGARRKDAWEKPKKVRAKKKRIMKQVHMVVTRYLLRKRGAGDWEQRMRIDFI